MSGVLRSGAAAIASRIQNQGAERLADRLRRNDPALLARLAEIGVVRQAWIDDPDDRPAVQATRPLEVLQRAVESRADHRPAPLSRLGLSAVRAVSDLGLGQAQGEAADGLLLRFADPIDAVRAALDIVGAAPHPLRVRAGLHRGPLLVQHGDVFGHTVNVAARVADIAEGGHVMISADIYESVGPVVGLEFGRLRRQQFKGVAERVAVCEVRRA